MVDCQTNTSAVDPAYLETGKPSIWKSHALTLKGKLDRPQKISEWILKPVHISKRFIPKTTRNQVNSLGNLGQLTSPSNKNLRATIDQPEGFATQSVWDMTPLEELIVNTKLKNEKIRKMLSLAKYREKYLEQHDSRQNFRFFQSVLPSPRASQKSSPKQRTQFLTPLKSYGAGSFAPSNAPLSSKRNLKSPRVQNLIRRSSVGPQKVLWIKDGSTAWDVDYVTIDLAPFYTKTLPKCSSWSIMTFLEYASEAMGQRRFTNLFLPNGSPVKNFDSIGTDVKILILSHSKKFKGVRFETEILTRGESELIPRPPQIKINKRKRMTKPDSQKISLQRKLYTQDTEDSNDVIESNEKVICD